MPASHRGWAVTLNPHAAVRAFGGSVSRRNVLAPGPGHSRVDRSLSINSGNRRQSVRVIGRRFNIGGAHGSSPTHLN